MKKVNLCASCELCISLNYCEGKYKFGNDNIIECTWYINDGRKTGMEKVNFIEAVKSGRRFKESNMHSSWYTLDSEGFITQEMGSGNLVRVNFIASMVSNKFILEEKSITITESELDVALVGENFTLHKDGVAYRIKKALGF